MASSPVAWVCSSIKDFGFGERSWRYSVLVGAWPIDCTHQQPSRPINDETVPSVVFAYPPVATLGFTENDASIRHDRLNVYRTEFTPMRHTLCPHGVKKAMKLVCPGPAERIVGIHLIGDGVKEMLQGLAVTMQTGAPKAGLDSNITILPVGAEELVTLRTPYGARSEIALSEEPAAWRNAS